MKAFIVGSAGQLGRTLAETVPRTVEFAGGDLPELDISDMHALDARLATERPDFVVNAAGYTAVDKAESEPDDARRVNVDGARNVARAALQAGARVIYISTDFVFDGRKNSPYLPDDEPAPLCVYGRTKLDGEAAVRDATDGDATVIRTAWLYSRFGQNFVKTMLRLMANRDEISVVDDQRGSPTWARTLAEVIWAAIDADLPGGVYHWTDGGEASWYEFAAAIYEEAIVAGVLDRPVTIRRILASEYPAPARRPAYSVLDCCATVDALGLERSHWTARLQQMLEELRS